LKEWVPVSSVVSRGAIFDPSEPIHLELPTEGVVFCMIEILWHHDFGKFFGFVDLERLSMGLPRYNALLVRSDKIV
jgi:hypothetical protein